MNNSFSVQYVIKLLCPLKTNLEIKLGLVILPNCRLQIIGKRNLMSSYKVSSLDRLLVLMASIKKKSGSQMYNVEKGSIDLKVFLDHGMLMK